MWEGLKSSYQARVAATLNKYGLKYDDLLLYADEDYDKAVSRMSPHDQMMRTRRIKRAFDIDFKGKYLPEELQKIQDPLEPYAYKLMEEAKARRLEREMLNSYK